MKQLAEKFRNKIFWTLDALKGGKLIAHYKDIAQIMENYGSLESRNRRAALLNQLLSHATETTEFYSKYKNCKNLEDYPVVDKAIMRNNFEHFQSCRYKNRKKVKISSSGSTGTPFKVYQNIDKIIRNRADTIYFQQTAGYKIGYRLYYIRKWLGKYKMDKLTALMRNIKLVNVTDFSDAYLDKLVKDLRKDTSTTTLLSYSSALRDICHYLENTNAKPLKTNISSIIAMAEGLGDETREKLKMYFNAPVFLRYSNQENGILSLQLSQSNNNLQINWASYFIEILHPEKDIAVQNGELGRVVITDLFNYCMPFIRYDTGDFAVITEKDAYFKGSLNFSKVEGRKMDLIYDTSGNVRSSFNVYHLDVYPDIRQFQFVQESQKEYSIKLTVRSTFKRSTEKSITAYFKNLLGTDARINIRYVEEIPHLKSGKRRIVVNNSGKETVNVP